MAIVNQQNVQVKNGSTWYKVCPFPVGFIYLSQTSTSPATTFGGTWAALNEDRFLRPSNAWTTGGSKKISVDQMPSHTHNWNGWNWLQASTSGAKALIVGSEVAGSTTYTGGGKDYWPQYRDCYGWYRTA